jgi:protein-L-isoaspartate(D-aspartate) O-methyltransferase
MNKALQVVPLLRSIHISKISINRPVCAPSHIPQPLKDQLAEGGKMVIPVGERFEQKLVLLTKEKGIIRKKNMIPVRFVPMMREDGREY